jgi:HlyD family secretion protein
MTRRRKVTIFGLSAVVLVAVVATAGKGKEKGTSVRFGTVERHDLTSSVIASGRITPKRKVDVSSDITGRIIQLVVEEGDEVQRGELLLRVDPAQYEAAVSRNEAILAASRAGEVRAQANRDQAWRNMRRQQQLKETNPDLVSQEILETAETNFEIAEANLNSTQHQVTQSEAALAEAQDQLGKTVITAPMTGKITRLAVEEGEIALASTFSRETGLLLTISDLSVIQVDVDVDETDVVRLMLGDSAEIKIDAFPDTTFAAVVTKVSQSARISGGGAAGSDQAVDYEVELTMTDPPADVRPDLSATAKIITDTRDQVLAIPIIALTVREHHPISTEVSPQDTTGVEETEGVFVVTDGIARFQPVEIGISGEERFEVLLGLNEGDSIISGPYQTVRDLTDSTAVRSIGQSSDETTDQ